MGSGAPFASAVPFAFRKQSRNGSPTVTAAPFIMPRNTCLRPVFQLLICLDPCSIRLRRRDGGPDLRGGYTVEIVARRDGLHQFGQAVAVVGEVLRQTLFEI